jgi:glycine hydroxymethyltransferase
MKEADMEAIGKMIAAVIREPNSEEVKTKVKKDVAELTAKFPMYQNRSSDKAVSAN